MFDLLGAPGFKLTAKLNESCYLREDNYVAPQLKGLKVWDLVVQGLF